MRWLGWGLTGLVALWAGWWWIAATTVERSAAAWFAALGDAGWDARQGGLSVAGFPSRLDLTVTAPQLYDPVQQVGWTGAFAQVLALAYRPWHVIAALPPDQTIRLGEAELRLTSDRLRASLVVAPSPALTLERIAIEGDGLRLAVANGAAVAASLRAGTRGVGGGEGGGGRVHDAALALAGLRLDAPLPPEAPAGDASLRLEMRLTFSDPLDRHAPRTRPRVLALDLAEGRLVWGPMVLAAQGSLRADAAGLAEGRIEITADDWPRALALATAAGLVDPGLAPTWAAMAGALSDAAGTPGRVAIPLILGNGRMSLGPLPIGPAPRL
ncbi:MAG: DUF2125 domain-containing protein [Gemmobacter sp.]